VTLDEINVLIKRATLPQAYRLDRATKMAAKGFLNEIREGLAKAFRTGRLDQARALLQQLDSCVYPRHQVAQKAQTELELLLL